jgi:hypothetical protein
LDALFELADSGLIGMQPKKETIKDVEQEATFLALRAAALRERIVESSKHC